MIIIHDDLPFSRPAITGYFFSILLFAELILQESSNGSGSIEVSDCSGHYMLVKPFKNK